MFPEWIEFVHNIQKNTSYACGQWYMYTPECRLGKIIMGLRQAAAGQLAAKIIELERGNLKISMHLYGRWVVHCNMKCGELS